MSPSILDIAITCTGLSLALFLYYTKVSVPRGLRLPPGPPRHPIWGNLRDFPFGILEYKVYEKWAKKYGDLVYLNILGQSMLFVNSADMAREMFSKRGAICSDRHKTAMIHDLTTFGKATLLTMDYGERWTRHRAILHDVLSSRSLLSYHPVLEANARSFTCRLIAERVNDLKFSRDVIGGFIMQFVYGIDVLPENDPYVILAEGVSQSLGRIMIPGAYMVDNFPIMKHLPSWLPGLKFPKVAEEVNKDLEKMQDIPYAYSKKAFSQGKYKPSFVSKHLEELANNPNAPEDAEETIRQTAFTIYVTGIDTLDTQFRLFFLAMALYPDVQKKAQEELDRVVGRDNLPSFNDLPSLPYLNAVCNESFRWQPVTPMAIPHKLNKDDVINGYFIPKGTNCFGNSWFLLRSEEEYGPDTNKFKPERFLDGSAKSKPDPAFGYGRRVCPGRALAEAFINIVIATVLHVANISTLKDEPLSGIVENDEFSPGLGARPRDFRCQIDVRPDAQNLLNQSLLH